MLNTMLSSATRYTAIYMELIENFLSPLKQEINKKNALPLKRKPPFDKAVSFLTARTVA